MVLLTNRVALGLKITTIVFVIDSFTVDHPDTLDVILGMPWLVSLGPIM
jgi:hypothetical protein